LIKNLFVPFPYDDFCQCKFDKGSTGKCVYADSLAENAYGVMRKKSQQRHVRRRFRRFIASPSRAQNFLN
jgi:hypothetical protein